ncbi:hypothetical protein NQ314_011107 [Rhamnusium bicolor]|uniref:Alpha-mannosidase n=1 Tax=Rhamnusium bicolor TaxID=1586634 RepID=A0AAV8XKM4_9CUCU|nr:hypothetical protein NQ314_011107 [Rhamnusium bicolor]
MSSNIIKRSDSIILASVLYNHYSAPSQFCFEISYCNEVPIVSDTKSPEYNLEFRVNRFVDFIRNQIKSYPTNNILITLGDDFAWKAAHSGYINIDRLIEGFKLLNPKIDGREINLIYSTPSCYTKAVRDYIEINKVSLDLKTDDFFPYADGPHTVWSGYFTSRPSSKRLERLANNLLQVTKQITTLGGKPYGTNELLSQAMGVMQHHDAITGTERTHVEKSYHESLVNGMQVAISDISSSLSSILGINNDLNLKSCLLSNVSICVESDKDEFTVLIYNPLARSVSHYIQIPVNDGTWKITGPSGEEVENYLTEPISNFTYITKASWAKVLDKVLFFRAENLPALGYKELGDVDTKIGFEMAIRHPSQQISLFFIKISKNFSYLWCNRFHTCTYTRVRNITVIKIYSLLQDRYINFDPETGLLKSITLNGITLGVFQKMLFYATNDSGAYIFRPDENIRNAVEFGKVESSVLTNKGNLIRELKQVWGNWITQIIRIYKEEDFIEYDWLVGPIDISPTYEYSDEEPQSGNYYPVNTKILIKDKKVEFAVLPDRSEGGTSLSSGQIELMLSRALLHDDKRGVGESLNEMEYSQPLVVRGSHFVTLGDSLQGNDGRTMAAVERDIAQRKLLQPWVFYTSADVPVKEQSFLNEELPRNVHLLTLENWRDNENTILIRLEHILEKDEDPELSKEIEVDISNLFKTLKIRSMKEFLLAGNTPIEESTRLKWSQISETENQSSPLNIKNRLARDEDDLKITLAPMQIRTFVATIEQ